MPPSSGLYTPSVMCAVGSLWVFSDVAQSRLWMMNSKRGSGLAAGQSLNHSRLTMPLSSASISSAMTSWRYSEDSGAY